MTIPANKDLVFVEMSSIFLKFLTIQILDDMTHNFLWALVGLDTSVQALFQ